MIIDSMAANGCRPDSCRIVVAECGQAKDTPPRPKTINPKALVFLNVQTSDEGLKTSDTQAEPL